LVAGGDLVMRESIANNVKIIPVDSEHSAIFQCLQGENIKELNRLILTASGGPFRKWEYTDIQKAKAQDALKHPNWSMGRKISIDSATLMNKGLEVIEAKWLFDVDLDKIDVVIHPQSIIHSMIELIDNSVIAQLGVPDMKLPIQYAFSYPKRIKGNVKPLDFGNLSNLTFKKPDTKRFPCLTLAYEAMKIGKTMPCILNAANELLVEYYLKDKINFYDIPRYIEKVMEIHNPFEYNTVEELLELEKWVRIWLIDELR